MSKIVSLNDVLKEIEGCTDKKKTKKDIQAPSFNETEQYKKQNNSYANGTAPKKKSSKAGFKKRSSYDRCKNSAIYSLAMREHSRLELRNKLKKKDYAKGVDLEKLLDELEESNYLNEERFVESFIRYRSDRGQGFIKISNELRLRGIRQNQITRVMQKAEINWYQIASEQRIKKFGETPPQDFKEKARQMRFLSGRGFEVDIIREVVE